MQRPRGRQEQVVLEALKESQCGQQTREVVGGWVGRWAGAALIRALQFIPKLCHCSEKPLEVSCVRKAYSMLFGPSWVLVNWEY